MRLRPPRSAVPITAQKSRSAKTERTDEGKDILEDILEDISDGFGVLKAVPVDFFLSGFITELNFADAATRDAQIQAAGHRVALVGRGHACCPAPLALGLYAA